MKLRSLCARGASVVGRVMGRILSSVAVTKTLGGLKTYFQL